jgi:hypothetical protein
MRLKNSKAAFADRNILAAYCRAEGLAMGTFKCARCDLILDWYGLPADKPAKLECPVCHYQVEVLKGVAS